MGRKGKPAIDRLLAKVIEDENGCWIITRGLKDNGYSQVYERGKVRHGHRVSYEHYKGEIPEGLTIDHLCRVKSCINPEHLEAVSQKVNLGRVPGSNASKTHCPKGHPYDKENTHIHTSGGRRCRTCHRNRMREHGANNREESRAKSREYYWNNRERLLKDSKDRSTPESRAKKREYNRKYYAKNRERILANNRAKRQLNWG